MDIFQQWLLLRIQEQFGIGVNPMENGISFTSIVNLIKPIFEEENALLDEAELKRNLDVLVALNYLTMTNDMYFLTFRAIVYSQSATSLTQLAKEEFGQYVIKNWWKAVGVVFLLVILVSVIASILTVNIVLK